MMSTAWGPMLEPLYHAIEKNFGFDGIDITYTAQEPNMQLFITNDGTIEGKYFVEIDEDADESIGTPLIGYTQTFISFGSFETVDVANNCMKYIKSKFARTLLGILKVTQNNSKDTWRLVPLQDFTSASDIDWSQSIDDIDEQLYSKYNLTDEEIEFIERNIQPMD